MEQGAICTLSRGESRQRSEYTNIYSCLYYSETSSLELVNNVIIVVPPKPATTSDLNYIFSV